MKISRQIFDLFLGNKSDLDDRREVTESTAAQFAAEKGMAYIETSARDSANIREAFLTLVKPRLRLNRAASTATTWSNTLKKQKSYTRHSKTLILKKNIIGVLLLRNCYFDHHFKMCILSQCCQLWLLIVKSKWCKIERSKKLVHLATLRILPKKCLFVF